jgi:hypothetical protein
MIASPYATKQGIFHHASGQFLRIETHLNASRSRPVQIAPPGFPPSQGGGIRRERAPTGYK